MSDKRGQYGRGSITPYSRNPRKKKATTPPLPGWQGGKRRSRIFDSTRKAQAWIDEQVALYGETGPLVARPGLTTLAQLVEAWYMAGVDDPDHPWRPATREQYRRTIDNHVLPGPLAGRDAATLRPSDIEAWLVELRKGGVSRGAIRIIHVVLSGALKRAQRMSTIERNPAQLVEYPGKSKRGRGKTTTPSVWTPQQIRWFIEFMDTYPKNGDSIARMIYRLRNLLIVAIYTGARRGELLALKEPDLDNGWLTIDKGVYRPEGGGFIIQGPKSPSSTRKIPVPPEVADAIAKQRECVLEWRTAAQDTWQEHGLIFPSTIGTPIDGFNVSRDFRKISEAAALPHIRFHDLRHTAATMMRDAGVPSHLIAAYLGHSSAVITDSIYVHAIRAELERVAEAMSERMRRDN